MSDINRYLQAATRDNTRLSYRAAVEHFESHWGGFLPATADSVARYLVDYANTLSVNTLRGTLLPVVLVMAVCVYGAAILAAGGPAAIERQSRA